MIYNNIDNERLLDLYNLQNYIKKLRKINRLINNIKNNE